jgi:spore coat polysaccharide biosynthesis protein SpsF
MKKYRSKQEEFWSGEFGNSYSDRNKNLRLLAAKTAFLSRALSGTLNIKSVIELGANIGLNLHALRVLFPEISLAAVEINKSAYKKLCQIPDVKAYCKSIFDFTPQKTYSLSISCGVMIHINPELLSVMYDILYRCTDRYILVAEYYNPTPVNVMYRGYEDRLFKRDFAGEMLKKYPDLSLVDYGFVYHQDPNFPLDDLNWFLLSKSCR